VMLVLEGAEETLDDAVGLRALDAGADMAQQRVLAGERLSKDGSAEAGPVVADHSDWRGHSADQFTGGVVDKVELTAVVTQVLEHEDLLGVLDRGVQAGEGVWPRAVGVTVTARQYLVA
jgi:hypothetical protein